MTTALTRRQLLKLAGLALGGTAFAPLVPPRPEQDYSRWNLGRVTTTQISLHSLPRDDSRIIRQLFRDDLLNIYREITPPTGPAWNPLWYRVWGGYVHSKHIQKVKVIQNQVVSGLAAGGQLAEITVPFSQTMRFSRWSGWTRLYRLYYQTTHWVTGLEEGPDGLPWYQLTDELGDTEYYILAHHVRLIPEQELAPISPDVDPADKHIEVDLGRQTLTAYQGDNVVLHTKISSGVRSTITTNGIPTETPKGTFRISVKMPSKHMGEGRLTDNLEDYELVGVPWTAFFHQDGYAIHGTYWHNNFGVQMSRGCINMRSHEAKWLFRWMTPPNDPGDIQATGYGTLLEII